MGKHRQTLEQIYTALVEVGMLSASIHNGDGDKVQQWQKISALDHRLRRLTKSLPDEIFLQLPCIAGFSLSSGHVFECWSTCQDEVGEFLSNSIN